MQTFAVTNIRNTKDILSSQHFLIPATANYRLKNYHIKCDYHKLMWHHQCGPPKSELNTIENKKVK